MNILLSFYLLKGTEQTKEYWSGKATKQTSKDTMLHQREKLWQKLGELKQEIIKLRNILDNHLLTMSNTTKMTIFAKMTSL